jgi:hypothetical protein
MSCRIVPQEGRSEAEMSTNDSVSKLFCMKNAAFPRIKTESRALACSFLWKYTNEYDILYKYLYTLR